MEKLLPEKFSDLGRFTEKWVLPTEAVRHHVRLNSSFSELQDMYNEMLPQMEGILKYLNNFELNRLPEKEEHLMKLALSFMEIACAVECFKRSGIRGFDPTRVKVWK